MRIMCKCGQEDSTDDMNDIIIFVDKNNNIWLECQRCGNTDCLVDSGEITTHLEIVQNTRD